LKTDELIDLLAKDSHPPWPYQLVLPGAVAGGSIITAIVFFAGIGFRPDISEAVSSTQFLFKFVVTFALAFTAIGVALGLGRPDGSFSHRGLTMAIAPALPVCAAVVELLAQPQSQWMPRLVGDNARLCLMLIPLLAIGPLACRASFRCGRSVHRRPGEALRAARRSERRRMMARNCSPSLLRKDAVA
jgi:hypothetical protein